MKNYTNDERNTEKNRRLAEVYLQVHPFSYRGLIRQLKYDGCSHPEQIVEQLQTDWKAQADKAVHLLLDSKTCVEDELERYMKLEGFTGKEARDAIAGILKR